MRGMTKAGEVRRGLPLVPSDSERARKCGGSADYSSLGWVPRPRPAYIVASLGSCRERPPRLLRNMPALLLESQAGCFGEITGSEGRSARVAHKRTGNKLECVRDKFRRFILSS